MSLYREILPVANSAIFLVINHNLNDPEAVLSACTPGGWNGRPFITDRDNDTITVTFGMQAPPTGSLTLDVEVNGEEVLTGGYGDDPWDGTPPGEGSALPSGLVLPDFDVPGWGLLENDNLELIDDLIARIDALEAA